MDAKQAYDAGDLKAAIEAQTQAVKSKPTDAGARTGLFELLCFAGEWDRAQKQLDMLGTAGSNAAWGASVYQNLVIAERKRQKVFRDGIAPENFLDAPPFVQLHMNAINEIRNGNGEAALQLLEQSVAQQTEVKGVLNGKPVTGLKDADELLAPFLEVFLIQDYVWVPWQQVKSLTIEPPKNRRDLLWIPAHLTLTDDIERNCYLPVLYANSSTATNNETKLGRMTEFTDGSSGPIRGLGQHNIDVADQSFGLLDIRSFEAS
jgi:type VI secretion system protein ImpE